MAANDNTAPAEIIPGRPRSAYVKILDREMHYVEWGRSEAPAVILWHGLARTGRDFDVLGHMLANRFRLIAPDTFGRGLSQWSPDPDQDYCLEFLHRLGYGPRRCAWLDHV